MTATFNPDLSTPKDKVRQKLGDTDTANALVQDETIAAYLTGENMTPTGAAARLARELAARFARDTDFTVDGQGQKDGARFAQFTALADQLDIMATNEGGAFNPVEGGVSAGGIYVSGATSDDVIDARWDLDRASNAPLGFP